MSQHRLFYYPYASFTNAQLPLLKTAALYFDKLVVLDPVGASWDGVGVDHDAREAVRQLKSAGILEVVTPSAVLATYDGPMASAIREDIQDREFVELCEAHARTTGKQKWTLSLAKVPHDLQTDQKMRHLMGDFLRDVLFTGDVVPRGKHEPIVYDETEVTENLTQAVRLRAEREAEVAAAVSVSDRYNEGYEGDVEYRYATLPLAAGEAIMMNHALFGGLMHAGATPMTDDPFHNRALSLKLRRAAQEPLVRKVRSDLARQRRLKADLLAISAATDSELNLPVLNPSLPLEEVLEYRQKHDAALAGARTKLGNMARRIESEPWSEEFSREIEHRAIPDIAEELDEARKARDAWLDGKRGRLALAAAGIAAGGVVAVLSIFAAPLTPIALATAGLSLTSGVAIPGAEWLLDWRDGRKSYQENGLHYLLQL